MNREWGRETEKIEGKRERDERRMGKRDRKNRGGKRDEQRMGKRDRKDRGEKRER